MAILMLSKGKIPFVRLVMPLMTGIIIAKFFPVNIPLIFSIGIFAILFGFILLCILFYNVFALYKRRWLVGSGMHLFIFFIGYHLTLIKSEQYHPDYFSQSPSSGLVISVNTEPTLSKDIFRFEALVKHRLIDKKLIPASGRLLVALRVDSLTPATVNYGDLYLIPSRFTEVEAPYNPGEFDYKAFLENKQIYYQTFINQQQIVLLGHSTGNPVIAYALSLRQKLVARFNQYVTSPEAAAVAATLILGYRADLSKDTISAYSKTGTMHVLSVSGMHVGIFFLVLNWMLKPLDSRRKLRFLKPVLVIPLIWGYALITGFSPSVCRAALMLSFYVLGKSLSRSHNAYNLVAISAFFLLIYNPYYLFDVGFQLSYLAVLGLIYLHPKLYHSFYLKNWLADKTWNYSALSIAAQLATFPLSIYYFHQFPVYFLFSNLFIVLPVAAIMYAGFVFLLIPVEFVSSVLGTLLNHLIGWVNSGLHAIEKAPFSTINHIWISLTENLFMYGVLLLFLLALQTGNKRWLLSALTGTFIVLILTSSRSLKKAQQEKVVFYSLRKNVALSYIRGRAAETFTDLDSMDKTLAFSVHPALSQYGVEESTYYGLTEDNYRLYGNHFYWFKNFTLMTWDKDFNRSNFQHKISVNAVLLTGNPYITIDKLNNQVNYAVLLIDGTNPDYKISRWREEADKLGVKYRILKKDSAYVVDL